MKYSLIQVCKENEDGTINGVWVQDMTTTTLEIAKERTRATEKANSNRIKISIVEQLLIGCPNYNVLTHLTPTLILFVKVNKKDYLFR